MLKDIESKSVDIIITKSVSRFRRDIDSDLMIYVITAIAQAENETRSENMKWGLQKKAAQGTSKLYNRKCYGYSHDEKGELVINEK